MKKFLLTLMAVLMVIVSAVGCGEEDWTEVQSVVAYMNEEKKGIGYLSYVKCNYSVEEEIVELSEYIEAKNEQKKGFPRSGIISADKEITGWYYGYLIGQSFNNFNEKKTVHFSIFELQNFEGKTYYDYYNGTAYKYVIESYDIYIAKMRCVENDYIDIQYYDDGLENFLTIHIRPISYAISYFNK